jgi:predicted nucleotidyltransferase
MDRSFMMIQPLVQSIADQLAQIDGVVAVVLGGSWARGTAQSGSDVDIGIYYRLKRPPALAALRQLAQQLDDSHQFDLVTDFGEWGPWINGGGWLTIQGQSVDWLYRDLGKVEAVIDACCAGRPTLDHQPGHPHGFHNHIYLGEIFYCRPLHDPDGMVAALKEWITPYPPLLKHALIRTYLWQADFALRVARKATGRSDVFYVAGCLFQCVACLIQVLYALNERFFVNEKGAVVEIDSFALRPAEWKEVAQSVLSAPGTTPDTLGFSIERLTTLVQAVRAVCD